MPAHLSPLRLVPIVLAAMLVSIPAAAQSSARPRTALGISAGVAQFDMSGTGTAPFGALRLENELTSWLVADAALGILRPREQFNTNRTYIVPEGQLQAQVDFGRLRPYLGAGVGMLKSVSGPGRTYAIFSGATGVRLAVTNALDVRGELRVTGQSATLAQWTVGLARRF
jgi:hypothetical protein